jgi:glycosyltransferase involved in cell wall biosynthesis
MLRLKIIVNCGPCEAYIDKCLDSIKCQTYLHWEAYVTVDPYGDRTFERAQEGSGHDLRIVVTRNPRPLYSLTNLVHAIGRSQAQPEDVIVILDGDDWFYDASALQVIVDTYTTYDCWLTYGSWEPNVDDGYVGQWPPYPEGLTAFRGHRYLATQVRTWKKWLWDLIDDRDLRDAEGQYFRVTGDQAVMFPMLEMSGTQRAKHIPAILMIYNRATPHSDDKTKYHEMRENEAYIRSKASYAQLREKVLKEERDDADNLE